MPFIPVENVARFCLFMTHNGIPVMNTFHVQSANSSWTSGELRDQAIAFRVWWDANIKAKVSVSTVLTHILGTSLHTQISPVYDLFDLMPIAGTGTGTPLPGNVTIAVKWSTGNRGRSARGRTYHIGLCEEQVTGNLLDETFYTALLTAYQTLLSSINQGVMSMRVVSLWSNKVARTSGLATPITAASIESTVDTQRRRLV